MSSTGDERKTIDELLKDIDVDMGKSLERLQIQTQGVFPILKDWTSGEVRIHLGKLEKMYASHRHMIAGGFSVVSPSIASTFGPDLLETLLEFDTAFNDLDLTTAQDDVKLLEIFEGKSERRSGGSTGFKENTVKGGPHSQQLCNLGKPNLGGHVEKCCTCAGRRKL